MIRNYISLLLFSILFVTLPFTSFAQPAFSKIYTIEDDNQSTRINCMYQDNRGYILAGTTNGLYKFDGLRFQRINFQNASYSDTVTAIYQDRPGKIWIGFESGRIANLINGRLEYFNPEEGTPAHRITGFTEDKNGNLWFSSYGEGAYYIRNNRIFLVDLNDGMSDVNISSLASSPDGSILMATDQGLNICRINADKKTVRVIGPRQGLPDYLVTTVYHAGNGIFYVGMQDKGFCIYDINKDQLSYPTGTSQWIYGPVTNIISNSTGAWIATEESGLLKYELTDHTVKTFPLTTGTKRIDQLLKDLQGNLWLASKQAGLIKTSADAIKIFPLYSADFFDKIHCILSDKANHIWINDDDHQSLLRFNSVYDSGSAQRIRIKGLPSSNTDITSLYEDDNGMIWIGTMGRGVFILDPQSGSQRSLQEINLKNVLSISGEGSSVFISSLEGAIRVDTRPANKEINTRYDVRPYDQVTTGSHYIYSIFRDSRKRTWFASDGRGIFMEENGSFNYFNNFPQVKDESVYSITEDRKGNIWFSTAKSGIFKYDGRSFQNFNMLHGLSNLQISALKTNASGNIIVVHKKGLDVIDPSNNLVHYLNSNTGIENINTRDLGAISLDRQGNILVCTVNGVLSYQQPRGSVQQPVTIIESIQLFLDQLPAGKSNVFSHDENNFTFNYNGLYYTDPNQVYFQYQLEGLDSAWITTQDRSKTFPKLDPGKYKFRIRSSLNRNFDNAIEASYSFQIKQAFYKTWWFLLGCMILLIALVYMYIRSRENSLKNIQRLKEEKIQFQFEVLRNQVNPHFLFNSFNTLISAIEEDPKMAVEYVEYLSDFFRDIVNHRDKDVISLGEELNLLKTYFFLQQKRYGENLRMNINVEESLRQSTYIPPLTLQLLVENAIKHNIVSREKPLTISVESVNAERLVVRNNLNIRQTVQPGAGMGLQNIMNRYELLSNQGISFESDQSDFIVSLPLIKRTNA